MSMIKYTASYHNTEEEAEAYLYSLENPDDKQSKKRPKHTPIETTDNQDDSELQSDTADTIHRVRFVLIILYHIGEHRSFLQVVKNLN